MVCLESVTPRLSYVRLRHIRVLPVLKGDVSRAGEAIDRW